MRWKDGHGHGHGSHSHNSGYPALDGGGNDDDEVSLGGRYAARRIRWYILTWNAIGTGNRWRKIQKRCW